jgi:molecular chaperone GrpE
MSDQAEQPADGSGDTPNDAQALAEAARREAEENWNKYLRVAAELDNLRKRSAREIEAARKFGAERLAQAILPVRDSIEAALATADRADLKTLIEGEQATLRLLDDALGAAGITMIDPHGEPFDPAKHEALSLLPAPHAEPNTVLEVVQKGYQMNERLLRAAKVIVARGDT